MVIVAREVGCYASYVIGVEKGGGVVGLLCWLLGLCSDCYLMLANNIKGPK